MRLTARNLGLWSALAAVLFAAFSECDDAADDTSDEAGLAHLEANGKEDGVVTLASGLQYKIITAAAANASGPAKVSTDVQCHYEGKLLSGEVFDSSIARGKAAVFKPKDVVKGWREALLMMKVGDKWELTVPAELAYGAKGAGGKIPPKAVLVFTLEIVGMKVDTEHWLHEPIYSIGGFAITRMLIIPPFMALFISCLRAAYMGRATYARARHIVTEDERMCYKALSRANKGEDFGALALEFSTCRSGKKQGELGKFGRGTMAPEFDAVVFDKHTEIGKPYGPIKTQFGYHVLIVDERHISQADELLAYQAGEKAQARRQKKFS